MESWHGTVFPMAFGVWLSSDETGTDRATSSSGDWSGSKLDSLDDRADAHAGADALDRCVHWAFGGSQCNS